MYQRHGKEVNSRNADSRTGQKIFADDFLLGVTNKEDALPVMHVLPKRLGKYGLTLHPEKTKLIDFTTGKGTTKTSDPAPEVRKRLPHHVPVDFNIWFNFTCK